jgi:hypothetical protein
MIRISMEIGKMSLGQFFMNYTKLGVRGLWFGVEITNHKPQTLNHTSEKKILKSRNRIFSGISINYC